MRRPTSEQQKWLHPVVLYSLWQPIYREPLTLGIKLLKVQKDRLPALTHFFYTFVTSKAES